ncbi:MAG: low molecular weight phosphatase family protein [Prochloraceae cyanobacterium]|nr:low molecular weight phosphatase family protein [Prochloraceae cyanobacterium]
MKIILFLCTGNYYRSRFAEYLFNAVATERSISWRANSRGLALERGVNNIGPISKYATEGLAQRGIILSDRLRDPISAKKVDFTSSDKIIALDDREHRPLMTLKFPQWVEKIEYWNVSDIDRTSPQQALQTIEQNIRQQIELLPEF